MSSHKERQQLQLRQIPVIQKKAGPKSVLVVDDQPSIAKLLFEVLHKRLGYETEIAVTGEEAIDKLSRRDYDVIFLDIRMPRLNGRDLLALLKTMDEDLPHRVIFCTGDLLNPETQTFLDQHKNLCLAKPFGLEDVNWVLEEFIKRRPRSERSQS
ncbi:MAG: response regulator [Nitrospirae bacterium]|nr:response regulator [Nitrospirota bacterium]